MFHAVLRNTFYLLVFFAGGSKHQFLCFFETVVNLRVTTVLFNFFIFVLA